MDDDDDDDDDVDEVVVSVVDDGDDEDVGTAGPPELLDLPCALNVPGGSGTSGTAAGPSLAKPRFENSSGAIRLLFYQSWCQIKRMRGKE